MRSGGEHSQKLRDVLRHNYPHLLKCTLQGRYPGNMFEIKNVETVNCTDVLSAYDAGLVNV